MEYTQITIDDYLQMKEYIRKELQNVKHSFVRIGYMLRKIDDAKVYEREGYKSIAEFAKAEYGLGASTTSRFMSINKEYSVDGYSETLLPEYEAFDRSQLEEMLLLPASDRQLVSPDTPREDIRELKRFNKSEPAAGEADSLHTLVESFFKDNEELLDDLYASEAYTSGNIKAMADMVNPAGSRIYKKGLYFAVMSREEIRVKKFGGSTETLSWQQFFTIMQEIFAGSASGRGTYRKHFGKAEDEPEKTKKSRPVSKNTGEIQNTAAAGETEGKKSPQNGSVHLECENTAISEMPKSEFDMTKTAIEEASPQNGSANVECENTAISETPKTENEVTKKTEEIPGIAPTACQPAKPQDVWGQQEEGRAEETNDAQAAGMTRKDYICSLSVPDAAEYLKAEHRGGRLTVTMFHFVDQLGKWLGAYVDEYGSEIYGGE